MKPKLPPGWRIEMFGPHHLLISEDGCERTILSGETLPLTLQNYGYQEHAAAVIEARDARLLPKYLSTW